MNNQILNLLVRAGLLCALCVMVPSAQAQPLVLENHFSAGTASPVYLGEENDPEYPRYRIQNHINNEYNASSSLTYSFQYPANYNTIPTLVKSTKSGTASAFSGFVGSHAVLKTTTSAYSNDTNYTVPAVTISRASYSDVIKYIQPSQPLNVIFKVQGVMETSKIGLAQLGGGSISENRVGSRHGFSEQPANGLIPDINVSDFNTNIPSVFTSYYSESIHTAPTVAMITDLLGYPNPDLGYSALGYNSFAVLDPTNTNPDIIRWLVSYEVRHTVPYSNNYEGFPFEVSLYSKSSSIGSISFSNFGNSMYVLGVTDSNGDFLNPSSYSFASGATPIPEPSTILFLSLAGLVVGYRKYRCQASRVA